MTDESYGIMPFSEIQSLKKDISDLKAKGHSQELLSALERVHRTMESMLHLFKTAADEKEEDDKSGGALKPVLEKLDEVIDQNRTIAEGMVALSEIVQEAAKQPAPPPSNTPSRIGPQPISPRPLPPNRPAPPPPQQSMAHDNPFPPPQQGGMPADSPFPMPQRGPMERPAPRGPPGPMPPPDNLPPPGGPPPPAPKSPFDSEDIPLPPK